VLGSRGSSDLARDVRGFAVIPQAASAQDTYWDFISLMPESMRMIMWAMSDRALPESVCPKVNFGMLAISAVKNPES